MEWFLVFSFNLLVYSNKVWRYVGVQMSIRWEDEYSGICSVKSSQLEFKNDKLLVVQ